MGTYIITYTATDSAGNMAAETRTVNVIRSSYLTLDDFEDAILHDPSFKSNHFSGSQNCALCHDGLKDSNGKDVSLVKAWQSTMMANAATILYGKQKLRLKSKNIPNLKQLLKRNVAVAIRLWPM